MEELIIIVIILVLVFGLGTIQLLPEREILPEDEITVGNIAGNETFDFTEKGDINLDFRGHISGNATVNIESERGNIYLRFREHITGNPDLNIKTRRGHIFIGFESLVEGNPSISIESHGDIIFANDRSTIEEYRGKNLLQVKAGGRIYYGDDSFFRRFRSGF